MATIAQLCLKLTSSEIRAAPGSRSPRVSDSQEYLIIEAESRLEGKSGKLKCMEIFNYKHPIFLCKIDRETGSSEIWTIKDKAESQN